VGRPSRRLHMSLRWKSERFESWVCPHLHACCSSTHPRTHPRTHPLPHKLLLMHVQARRPDASQTPAHLCESLGRNQSAIHARSFVAVPCERQPRSGGENKEMKHTCLVLHLWLVFYGQRGYPFQAAQSERCKQNNDTHTDRVVFLGLPRVVIRRCSRAQAMALLDASALRIGR
jgi:hypothetical protein